MENTTGRRRRRERNYVTIENSMFEDNRISWKAKGLLGYLLTKPDGWIVRITDLVKHSTDGDKAIRSAIKELKTYGYLTFTRTKNEKGQWNGTIWEYDDIPMFDVLDSEKVDEKSQTLESQGIDPYADFRHVENRHAENGTHISNKDFSNKDFSNNIEIDDDKRRNETNLSHSKEEEIELIISNLRKSTKDELTDRSFNSIVKKVVDKHQQGKVNSFRDYLTTALIKKIEELELRRNQDNAQQERTESVKINREEQIRGTDVTRPVPFYNWLEERG